MKLPWLVPTILAFAATTRDARGATPEQPIRPGSTLWITGASNIRRFTCRARQLRQLPSAADGIRRCAARTDSAA